MAFYFQVQWNRVQNYRFKILTATKSPYFCAFLTKTALVAIPTVSIDRLEELKALLATPKKVVITTHYNPDGDAIGSSLGLSHYLRKKGHLTTVIAPNEYPKFLHWMPGNQEVILYDKSQPVAEQALKHADLIFCLDYNAPDRVKDLAKPLQEAEAPKMLIDHHLQPEDFTDFSLHTTQASSTAELVYDFIEILADTELIDYDIAACLYTGILTDTGSFQHASTTARVHEITADLMREGLDTFDIYDKIFNTASISRMRFFGHCWSNRMFVNAKVGYAIIEVSIKDQLRFHMQKGDTEGLVNTPLQIDGIQASVLATEQEGYVKLSFRSKGAIDMNTYARQHFNGGGHKNAAGGMEEAPLEKVIEKIKHTLPKYLQS